MMLNGIEMQSFKRYFIDNYKKDNKTTAEKLLGSTGRYSGSQGGTLVLLVVRGRAIF